ncbi:MAG TPA: FecR domain-containing protein [Stellaceae bacterium]|nr:FecR domain-containing protein [Stellaceae bacterium]
MSRRRLVCAAVIAGGWLALQALADEPPAASVDVGRSIFIANDVDGRAGDAPPRRIAVNDDIVFEEDITTGDAAKAVVEFRDGSTFEIGPDAVVRIDAFVFNPEESTSHKTLNVTRGVFRYVSGYIASDQEAQVKTPSGTMAIRGSVAAGIVDPAVPDFLFLGEGNATFSNAAGSSALQPGNAIAVPSPTTVPMAPDAMPAPVAAQALQAIERRLPPRSVLANRPAADEAWLKRAGAADLVPAAEQQRLAAAGAGRPPPPVRGSGSLAGELGLLAEANRVNLFDRRQAARTPEQTAFLARAAREMPRARATLRRATIDARAVHAAAVTRGTAFVLRGVGRAAPSAAVMQRVTAASTRANPGAAAAISRQAGEAYRGADRGELSRGRGAGTEQPGERRPGGQQPGGRQPGGQQPGGQRPGGQQPGGQRPGGQRPGGQRPNGQQHEAHSPNGVEHRRPGDQHPRPGVQRHEQRGGQQRRQPGGNARQPAPQRSQAAPPQRQERSQRDRGDQRRDGRRDEQ